MSAEYLQGLSEQLRERGIDFSPTAVEEALHSLNSGFPRAQQLMTRAKVIYEEDSPVWLALHADDGFTRAVVEVVRNSGLIQEEATHLCKQIVCLTIAYLEGA